MDIQEPKNRLSQYSVKVWLIREALQTFVILLIFAIVFYLDARFEWKVWIHWIIVTALIFFILSLLHTFTAPFFLYKNWRYGIDSEFLQLKWGFLSETHQLVPMTKIQAVSTKQGPLLRKYNLCAISVKTMGSTHMIPMIPKEEALLLRNQIAQYAKIKEVEQ